MTRPVLFFHVQHLLGIGHQMRAAAIARACEAAGIAVHYVTGGFEDRDWDLGGATIHQLPPVRVRNRDFSEMVDENGQLIDDAWWDRRSQACMDLFNRLDPDLLMLEGFPFARRKFGRELLPVIDIARQRGVPVVSSVRDILVPPASEKKRLKALEIAGNHFDRLLVHGDPDFIRLEDSLPGAEGLSDRLAYTGYVDGGDLSVRPSDNRDGIVVSVGGGAVGEALLRLAVAAARNIGDDRLHWRLLCGPNLPDQAVRSLETEITGLNVTLEPARPDFRQLLATSRLSISQAGYNTVMDLMAARCPALLVPFGEGGESEQPMRARLLADRGLVTMLSEQNLSAEGLAHSAVTVLSKNSDFEPVPFTMNGAEATAAALLALAGRNGV